MKFGPESEGMAHSMKKGFGAKRAFGEPIKVNDKITIIPVVKASFGGGGGGEEVRAGEEQEGAPESGKKMGSGYGFGGGVKPLGYIKIKGSCVRFKHICDWDNIIKMMMPPLCLFLLIIKHKMMKGHMQGMGPWDRKMMMKKKMMMHGMPGHQMGPGPMCECQHHKHMHPGK